MQKFFTLVCLCLFSLQGFAQDLELFEALEKNDLSAVQKALKNEAKVNQPHPKTRWLPLHYAVQANNLEIVKLLLKKEGNPNLQTPITDSIKGTGRFTPLHLAVQLNQKEMVRELVKGGAKTEIKGQAGFTPLHLAVKNNNLEITQYLLEKEALINTRSTQNLVPLHLAIEQGNAAMVDLLLQKGADKEASTKYYSPKQLSTWSPLLIAVWLGKDDIAQNLLAAGANVQAKSLENQNALHLAVLKDNIKLVKILIEKGINRDLADKNGKTPVKLAQEIGDDDIIDAIEDGTFYGKIRINELDLSGKTVSGYFQDTPATLAPTPDGGAVLTWQDKNGDCHLRKTDAQDQWQGNLVTLAKTRIFSTIGLSDGWAILFSKEEKYDAEADWRTYTKYFLAKYNLSGNKIFETKLLGDDNLDKEGNRVADASGRNVNTLAWSGKYFAAYLAIYQDFGDKGDHQGDALIIVDANGKIVEKAPQDPDELVRAGGWDWGVSHSFSQRMMHDGRKFVLMASGDANPRGLAFSRGSAVRKNTLNIESSPYQYQDIFSTRIGNLLPNDKTWVFPMMTQQARPTQDIAWLQVDSTGKLLKQVWLTNTPNQDEIHPRMATFGKDQYLVMWDVCKRKDLKQNNILENIDKYYQEFVIIDKKGTIITPKPYHSDEKYYKFYPEKFKTTVGTLKYVDLDFGQRKTLASDKTDFINFSNGDVGVLRLNPDQNKLQLIRIKVE
ncbi:MAG: ankyrin repeat domain-containing protein [Microscillaceae bacterium]|jgi:ankyrin repeat protein|nr:ankyrin repeat domain-containing protein [Microscillaceae bacterium]